jgi:uncharacterized repeat protein (TIGR01451 family)
MMRLILSLFLFISIVLSSSGQEVKITSAFDSTKILIGDQINYTVTVEKPSNLKLALPVFKDSLCKNIEILSGPRVDSSVTQNGRIKIIQKYLVTSFDSGRYQVKPYIAEARSIGGLKRFYSDYSVLEVMRTRIAPADTSAKIYDIIKPYRAPLTLGEVLPWALIAIIAGLLIWVAIRFFKRFKKSESVADQYLPADPAHVIAFRELERLRNEGLWQRGEIKKYYTQLTEILRQYLENRYKVFSLELTTAETLDALVKTGFRKDGSYNDLKSVLSGADLVKFAKYNPEPSENESHFQNSWNFILSTKENEEVAEPMEDKQSKKEGSL